MNQTKLILTLAAATAFVACGDDDDEMMGPTGRGAGNPPTLGAQIDRAGRAAASTAFIATFDPDSTAAGMRKDAYNAAAPAQWSGFKADIEASLGVLDSLDNMCGTQLLAGDMPVAGRYSALADVLVDDQLYVNSASGTCGTYLGLEGEIVGALMPGQGGCGGRTPNDDVIERSYSVLALGALTGFDDTIPEDVANHSLTAFPFLAAPN